MKLYKIKGNFWYIFEYMADKRLIDFLPDRLYLKLIYRSKMGERLNLNNPKKFSEKLQWLKLNDRKVKYTNMVDKYKVRTYVSDKLGEQYLIPLMGVWDNPNEIDFNKLPDKFVLKCNHNSGLGMCICKDKSKLDIEKVKAELSKGLEEDYYLRGKEWPYKNVSRKIICEKYIEDEPGQLKDYKFYCFNGKPLYCQVISDRFTDEKIDFYDMDWRHQDFNGLALSNQQFKKSPKLVNKPVNLELMKRSAQKLSENLKFSRIDFYEVDNKMYFGEITFYPASGFGTFTPNEWDYILGEYIKIPIKTKK